MAGFAVHARAGLQLVLVALAVLSIARGATGAESKTVLVLYSSTRLLPAAVDADRALREGLASTSERPIELYAEYLDLPRFGSPAFIASFARYLREKYSEHPPDVVLTGGSDALDLVVRNREQLFPHTPVVYIATTKALLRTIPPLPPDVIGVPVVYDSAGTIEQALRFHPNTRHLVVVTGASDQDREQADRLRDELAPFADRLAIEYASGLPLPELEQRLVAIGRDTVVFTPGFFKDGDNRVFAPREAAEKIAAASPAPVYGPYNTFIGTGIVGGRVPSFEAMGRQGAEIIDKILAGAAPESLVLPEKAPTRFELDWRQARRWGIREDALPADAVIHFKEPTFWEQYGELAFGAIAVMLLQAALIAALLVERRRRWRTAAALAESEGRMSVAAQAAGLRAWSWDPKRAETSGLEAPHPADRADVEKAVDRALARNEDLSIEYRVVGRDGEIRWISVYGRVEKGEPNRLLGLSRDVTERKAADLRAERDRTALWHMARVSMLGQLSASIAHQLNQPLSAILGNAEAARTMLDREPLDVVELREICDDIVGENQRAAEVIRRLSALFRHGELRLSPLDLNELVRETLELARTDLRMRHVTPVVGLASSLPAINADRIQLQQVLLNLIVNAADAMTEIQESERVLTIRTDGSGSQVRVSVADRGPGVPADQLESIFDPFWTTKPSGMGIGLSICRSITDAHRGSLTAATGAEGGAEFCVTLPVNAAA